MTAREFRALRRMAGLTQERAAQVLEVSHRTVLRWEHGESRLGSLRSQAIRERLTKLVFAQVPITEPVRTDEAVAKGTY